MFPIVSKVFGNVAMQVGEEVYESARQEALAAEKDSGSSRYEVRG